MQVFELGLSMLEFGVYVFGIQAFGELGIHGFEIGLIFLNLRLEICSEQFLLCYRRKSLTRTTGLFMQ